ncbi:MAG: DUF58 domain-containing protein [Acidobacteriota bacterium]
MFRSLFSRSAPASPASSDSGGRQRRLDLSDSLPAELFEQIQRIQIRTQRLVSETFAGEYESAFKGRGMEFEEVREYLPGDDIRHIDWNVTARTHVPHVKVHREERELTVYLLVDVSSSGAFGSATKLKREVAAEVAAILAYTAIHSNDRVGLVIFSEEVEHFVPPKKGRAHVWRVVRDILSHQPRHRGTRIAGALEHLLAVQRRQAVVFLVSDFLDQGWEDPLRIASRRHDLTAVRIVDRREQELPAIGLVELEDAESGELLLVDTGSSRLRRSLSELAADEDLRRGEMLRSAGVGEVVIHADDPSYIDDLVAYFHRREQRR